MKTVLITGANRGIGLGLTKRFLDNTFQVVATCRDVEAASDLAALGKKYPNQLKIVKCDVADPKSVAALPASLSGIKAIDFLVNNSGVFLDKSNHISDVAIDVFESTFAVNTWGPIRVTQALLPLIKNSSNAVLAHISSKMGSISDNASGGYYAYRTSKAALNMFNKSLAMEFKNMTSVVLHPGWVQTDMGGKNATTTIDQSVDGLFRVITNLKLKDSGKFFDFTGESIDW